jgi:GNAT superfamily N-acetyltransferase
VTNPAYRGALARRKSQAVVEIREAVADDAEVVARIYVESWHDGFGHLLGLRELTPERVARWGQELAGKPGDWAVAEIGGVVVGMVGVGPSRDPIDPLLGELDTIAVDPAHWRAGIGRCLMAHALGVLQKTWSRAILWTPANYGRGDAFYLATGWVPLDRSRRDGKQVASGRSL